MSCHKHVKKYTWKVYFVSPWTTENKFLKHTHSHIHTHIYTNNEKVLKIATTKRDTSDTKKQNKKEN